MYYPKMKLPTRNSSLAGRPAACLPPPVASPSLMTCGRKTSKVTNGNGRGSEALKWENTELFLQSLQCKASCFSSANEDGISVLIDAHNFNLIEVRQWKRQERRAEINISSGWVSYFDNFKICIVFLMFLFQVHCSPTRVKITALTLERQ